MQLGAVCDRTIDGEVVSFGTSGYTMNNVFVLYDRNTDSVWYPLTENSFDGVSGPNKGKRLEYIAKPEVMRLHAWAEQHPDTVVLIPTEKDRERRLSREQFIARLAGSWEMQTDFNGQMIDAIMTLVYVEGEGFQGTWTSMDTEMEMRDIRFRGKTLRFKRDIPGGQSLEFKGTIDGATIEGKWTSEMGEHDCGGKKIENEPAASQPED